MFPLVVKAPFDLEATKAPGSAIPAVVLTRCFGKQTPVTPHAQRLLVAHAKEVKQEKKVEKEKKSAWNKGKGHGSKVEQGAGAKKEKKNASKKKNANPEDSKDSSGAAETAPKTKTPYALAKDQFMDKFLASTQSGLYPYICKNCITI